MTQTNASDRELDDKTPQKMHFVNDYSIDFTYNNDEDHTSGCLEGLHDFRISAVFFGLFCSECKLKLSMYSFMDYDLIPHKALVRMNRIIKEQQMFKLVRTPKRRKP